MYPCKRCGVCCRYVIYTEFGAFLANEKGICKYLDENTNLCKIYEQRPISCNVDEYYKKYYSAKMTIEEFYQMNLKSCELLRQEFNKKWKGEYINNGNSS